jgi:hypothetical protein
VFGFVVLRLLEDEVTVASVDTGWKQKQGRLSFFEPLFCQPLARGLTLIKMMSQYFLPFLYCL